MRKFIMTLLVIGSIPAFAGGGADGTSADDGGHGIICRKSNSRWKSREYKVETLELYEFRKLYGSINGNVRPTRALLQNFWRPVYAHRELSRVKKKIKDIIGEHPILDFLDEAANLDLQFTADDFSLTTDLGRILVRLKENCRLIQLAVRRNNSVYIHQNYAQILGSRDIAAILLHEALHGYFEDKDSNLVVRQAVGFIFSNREFQRKNKNLFLELISSRQAVDQRRFRK